MTDMRKLQKAYTKLQKSHKNIGKAFSKIDDSLSEELLGEYDSPKLRRSLRKHGSGHRIHGVPDNIDKLIDADAVILIAGTSPKLSKTTDFNPTLQLPAMHYWRDGKRLSAQARSVESQTNYSLCFLSWHQNFTIHGEDDSHARKNLNLLLNDIVDLQALLQKEDEKATQFINACKDWLISNEKTLIVVSDHSRTKLSESISNLEDSNSNVRHIKAKLRGRNYQIMGQISEVLP